MALGADRKNILALVLRKGLLLCSAGIAAGLVAAFLLTRLMSGMLYKVGNHDRITFVVAPLAFLLAGLVACYLPARRATKVDPAQALRQP